MYSPNVQTRLGGRVRGGLGTARNESVLNFAVVDCALFSPLFLGGVQRGKFNHGDRRWGRLSPQSRHLSICMRVIVSVRGLLEETNV